MAQWSPGQWSSKTKDRLRVCLRKALKITERRWRMMEEFTWSGEKDRVRYRLRRRYFRFFLFSFFFSNFKRKRSVEISEFRNVNEARESIRENLNPIFDSNRISSVRLKKRIFIIARWEKLLTWSLLTCFRRID